ncbi:MAG: hypothetical protein ACH350_09195 [Parachlamydiaceae bacterium]
MKRQQFFQVFFIDSWWVIAFIMICSVFYEQGLKSKDSLCQQLTDQWISLQKEKEEALLQQQNLKLQINSQSDLAWIELTLMKGLGLVPEGQQKIYFQQDNP